MPACPHSATKVAIIGSGISGLSAAWLLRNHYDLTIYEADDRAGGHANTVVVKQDGKDIAVDTGFIVYNERNYPNLTELFKTLGVNTSASEMSFAASLDNGRLEYSGSGLNGLLGQRRNIIKPGFWVMVRDILRFYREAPLTLSDDTYNQTPLGDYLEQAGYGSAFVENHLLPMGAAIWSTSARDMKRYPLRAFVRFLNSHGLLALKDRPQWRTVTGGSVEYVQKLTREFADKIRLNAPVKHIKRDALGVTVTDASGASDHFSHIIIATHADQALAMMGDADERESTLLGAFQYSDNKAVLHTDTALMPKRKRVWSSWNYIGTSQQDHSRSLCVTYWMNRLQSIQSREPLLVTLNPVKEINPTKIIRSFDYKHPLFDQKAMTAQHDLWRLQGQRNTWFCGAYFGYGFHEDGLQAGLAAAEHLSGLRRPWNRPHMHDRISLPLHEAAE